MAVGTSSGLDKVDSPTILGCPLGKVCNMSRSDAPTRSHLDASTVRWLDQGLNKNLRSNGVKLPVIVPRGFEAYARIFHPVGLDEDRRRWADVAKTTGRVAHADMQWEAITKPVAGGSEWSGPRPFEGFLNEEEFKALAEALERFTATPDDCWFGFWDGDATWEPEDVEDAVQIGWDRKYVIYRGSLAAMPQWRIDDRFSFFQPPNVWWPSDRAWFVGLEIDADSTHVGASDACAAALLRVESLETAQVSIDHRINVDGDLINR
jgi:hypothetical protein